MISNVVAEYTLASGTRTWDLDGLVAAMEALYGTGVTADELKGLDRDAIVAGVPRRRARRLRRARDGDRGIQEGLMRDLERFIVLQTVDIRWREHLENMDYMREGIHLRGMAQKDPLVEYRNEGHIMFQELIRVDPRGGRRAPLPRRGRRADDDGEQRQQPSAANGGGERQPQLRARVARRRRRDRAPPAAVSTAGRSPAAARSRRRSRRAEGQVRAREHRPQRPVLVRLGQEVQALPRRLTRVPSPRSPAPRSASSRSRRARAAFDWLVARRGRPAVHARPVGRRARRSCAGWAARYVDGWAGRHGPGFAIRTLDGEFLGLAGFVELDREAREGEIGYVVAAGGARPRRRHAGGRPAHALGLRRARAERIELLIDIGEPGLRARRRAGRLPPGGRPPFEALQGGSPHRRRDLVPAS